MSRRHDSPSLPSGKHVEVKGKAPHELRQHVHWDDSPSAAPADDCAESDVGSQASEPATAHRDPNWSIQHHYTCNRKVVQVRQCDPDVLFQLRRFRRAPRIALAGFLKRYGKSDWMKNQRLYVQMAALAAAHEAMHPVIRDEREHIRLIVTEFDGIGLLNCGMRIKPRPGQPPTWICHQPEYCKRCNLWQRVEPAKGEFLPAFDRATAWYALAVMGRSNPALAGVKLEVGRDADGKPVYKWLFRLSDQGRFIKLPKFGVDPAGIPTIVSDGLFQFMNWLTDGGYFNGLHAFRDISFSFFPDLSRAMEVNHTANGHYHAYGNTSRRFTPKEAERMWLGCLRQLTKAGDGWPYVYPDIALQPLPTVEAFESAINYVIKPFKLAKFYIKGLEHGCWVTGLNYEFYQTAFESESLLFGPPQGYAFGNMSQKSGGDYIGVPRPKMMTKTQVKRFLEKVSTGEAHGWEFERHQNHLKLVARKKKRKEEE